MVAARKPPSIVGPILVAVAVLAGACSSEPEGNGGCADPGSGLGDVDTRWAGPGPPVDDDGVWPVDPRAGADTSWAVEILAEIPHDRGAFTQGLEFHEGRLLESTGCRGRSEVRELDPMTGAVVATAALPASQFGEGLTVAGDEIVQLTWQSGVARRLEATSLATVGEFVYDGEGWGICAASAGLVMSNGSAALTIRDPASFAVVDTVAVRRGGQPVSALNELECVDDLVLANVYRSDEIVVIEPATGEVLATIDAAPLRADVGTTKAEEVLNGIAAVGDGTLVLGGKHWPRHYVVRLTRD